MATRVGKTGKAVVGAFTAVLLAMGMLVAGAAPASAASWKTVAKFCGKDTCAWGKIKFTKTDRTHKAIQFVMHTRMRNNLARARTEMMWNAAGPDTGWGYAIGPCHSCYREAGNSMKSNLGLTIRGVIFRTCYYKESGDYVNCKESKLYTP
jgi:hypothetical protein